MWRFTHNLLMKYPAYFTASFYGDGFVQLKTVESSNKNSLHVRFRTSSPDGLLFLAAGENDFLWVALHSGRIQVRIELGSGERTLRSEKGTPLNDLMWHTLELYHNEHNVTLTVDKNSHGSLRMPAPDLELSVQEGLYVGGLGSLDKLYLFEDMCPVGFRGCMDEVLFNEHNLLSSLRPYSGFKMVHEVSLGCSPQFSASVNDSISFFSSKAYMSLPVWEVPQEGVFECELYTSAEEGLLLYSSAGQGDYVALEIRDRHLVVVVRIGGSKTALRATAAVNEGGWHSVRLYLAPRSLHLTVGEEILNSSFGAKSRPLQLSGPLFLGGVDTSTRAEVRRNGLLSVVGKRIGGGSFKGCLRNIRVNDQNMGLPNAVVTNDVSVGCEPVRHVEPVTTSSPATVQPDTTEQLEVDRKKVQTFLFFQDLEVLEGGRAPLESKHIKVNLEFRKLGIRQSQIMFRIEEQPVHGQLRLDVDPDQEQNTFSMLDLWHGRVMYVHGGSEDPLDFFIFSVFTSSKKEVPGYLKGNRLHRFNITVEPINDAPELSLPEGNLFVLLENSKRRLTTNMLRAMDPDTNSTELILTLLGNLTADAGFLELEDNPGQAVNSFSYLDLELGKVSYVHTGIRNSRMAIRASDGEKVSNTVVLRVMAVTLQHTVVNNTGVEVTQGGATHITNKHLAVQVNLAMQAMDIRFDVIEPPIYGELQRLHSSGEWKQTSTFTQKLLEKERLRYLSTFQASQLSNVTDSIKCKVTIGSLSTDEVVFVIRVRWIHYKVTRSKMEVDSDRAVILTPQEFRVISKGVKLSEDDIHIRLLTLPRKGDLLFNDEVLKKNSTFSQRNITDHKLQYKIFEKALEDMRDMFSFQVYSKYSHSGKHDFRISIKANVHSIVLRNHGLSVLEGESKVITKDMLFSETLSSRDVHYFVTSSPQHGKLARINHANSTTSSDNIVEFTNQDIIEESILYVHDDSETTHDAFMFRASLSPLKDKVTVTEGTFKISIQLVNDEKPVRVIDKVFHVARDSQRLLTLEDLCYHDPDSDYDNGQLLYTRRGIPMGELVWVNDTSHKLYQFHQRDLEEKRVLFVHRGVSFGRFVLFITDGKHYTSTLLEVSAQDPYLKVANNTGLLVQKGKEVILRPANFSITTNVDVRSDEDVLFEIFHPPSYGTLLCDGVEGDAFTLYDVKAGHVAYHHDNSMNMMDAFSFTATVNGLRLDVTVSVKVYLESHQRPPQVIHNNSVLVEEGKPVKIHKKELEVVHEDSTPDEIVYSMKTPASYGFLRRYVEGEDHYQGTLEKPIQSFSQVDINTGHIQYVQVKHGHSNDSFSVDVTNGILTVSDLIVSVEIIPLHIPLEVSNVTLKEGSSKALTQEVIKVTSRHFKGLHFQYHVIEGPHHGHIEHSRIPGVPIPSFTRMQVSFFFVFDVLFTSKLDASNLLGKLPEEERHSYEIWYGVTILPHYGTIVVGERNLTREKPNFSQFILNKYGITYVHDDSETTSDIFHFDVWLNHKGKPTQRPQDTDLMVSESFNITVTPVNDQPPFFKTQAPGLRVVKGDSVALGPENLQVEDLDTLPEDIHYTVISKPKNGFLALEGSLNESTVTFTQADVNAGKVYFVQDGHPTSGIFYFSVTDGFHHPLYKLFNLEVDNVTITVVNNTGLSLVQGQTTVTLTLQHLAAVTNKKNMTIKYHVTSPPSHGRLMIMDEVAICFDQDDLRLGKVSYHMTDLSSSQDSFELALLTAESNLTNQEVNITVKPLIHLGDHVRIADGVPVKLRKDVLDATELASISASDPIFEIIIPPKHGKLVKAAYGLGGPSQAVQSFSFTDIEQGRVAIEEHINFTAIYDNATNVQPAKGEFVYVVLPYDPKTGKHIIAETPVQPTRNPSVDRMPDAVSSMNHPSHTHPTTRPHRIPPKTRSRHRWGNHTRSRSTISTAPKSTLGKHDEPPRNPPVRVESLPRPASDPLLIILPFLACLLLIVILVVLTLVFRHRREKRAQPAMIPDIPENSGEDIIPHSPYLGQPERSLTVPSVVVTPLTPRCPVNPVLEAMHSAALVPAMAPPDSPLLLCTWTPVDHASTHQCSPATPTLRQNQYWV
uniref:Laminin G domain-containing protein n=1 Tax=Pygocentrus nattereri TaxID=42514 RepID=A0AAR2KHD5_PYGNA